MKPFELIDPSGIDAHIARTMSEREFTEWVIAEAERNGWRVDHVFEQRHYAKRSSKGVPDILAVRNGHVIVAELKSHKGRLTREQEDWIEAWTEVWANCTNVHVFVWRPADREQIIEILA